MVKMRDPSGLHEEDHGRVSGCISILAAFGLALVGARRRSALALFLLCSAVPACSAKMSAPDLMTPADAAVALDASADLARGALASPGPGGDFGSYADAAAAVLHGYFDNSTGLFTTTGWWNSANALTALIDYSQATGPAAYVGDVATAFVRNRAGHFLNDYYDDEGWWALAWIRAYDLTQKPEYLDAAKTIFSDMTGGWDATCNGGIWWSKAPAYKNAIAN